MIVLINFFCLFTYLINKILLHIKFNWRQLRQREDTALGVSLVNYSFPAWGAR